MSIEVRGSVLAEPERKGEVAGARILVVDDESIVREVIERYLVKDGFSVLTAADGREALARAALDAPDLVVLDLMLPEVDGLEVCRQLRTRGNVPIIMLTAKGEETDRVVGLSIGADDYLVKPFSPRELVARIKAVLRRSQVAAPSQKPGAGTMCFDSLEIDPRTRVVRVQGRLVELTRKEFDLLLFLASNPGQVFSREQLLNQVWDYEFPGDAGTVTVHIRRVREKIEDNPERPRYLKTVWGVGYKFEG